jgi:uncharacterized UPF0160 family protein
MPSIDNKYSEIWKKLKEDGHVTLAVPIPIQKRLLLAMKNIKHRDIVFKLEAETRKKKYVLYSKREQARIKLILREKDDIFQHLIE